MGSFRYLLLSLLAFLVVFTITSCGDDENGSDTVKCVTPTDCKLNQDCVFDSLTVEKGICANRVVCTSVSDCSNGLKCADDGDEKFCGTREVFGIKAMTLVDAKKGEEYKDSDGNTVTLELDGSEAEFYFEVVDPTKLPAGLEVSSEGNLTGVITADVGEYTFTVKAVNGPSDAKKYYNYRTATEELTLKVVDPAVKCETDSCPDTNKGVCDDSTGVIVCSCDTGYQDNNDDGTCEETCGMSNLGCTDTEHCDDASGTPECVCNDDWKDDDNGGKCNVCNDGLHIDPNDPAICAPNVKTVVCTNTPDPAVAEWDDNYDNGDYVQTWVEALGEYRPNTDPNKCLWKCLDPNKIHDADINECICNSGFIPDGNGGCKTPCADNQISNGDRCDCYPGYAGEDCLACATGYLPVDGLCKFDCTAKDNTHINDTNDNCVCDDGYFPVVGGDGECFDPCAEDDAPSCDFDKVCFATSATELSCICDTALNFVDNGDGTCGCDTDNTHRVLAQTGDSCECDYNNGYAEDLDGTCSLDTACTIDAFTAAAVNNTFTTATDLTSELASGSAHYDDLNNQAIDCSSDEDWYMISVGANQKLKVDIAFVSTDGNLDLQLYVGGDGYYDVIETSDWSSHDLETVEHVFREDTDVYIKVYGAGYDLVRNTYSMDVVLSDIPPVQDLSGGDTCDDAVEITASGVYRGSVSSNDTVLGCAYEDGNDVFYKLVLTEETHVKIIQTEAFDDFNANLALRETCADEDNDLVCQVYDTTGINGVYPAGTYFVVVEASGDTSVDYVIDVELTVDEPLVCDPTCDADKEVCSNEDGTATCICDAEKNYFYNGYTCVNPCSSVTCEGDATCVASSALDTQCVYDVVGANTCEPDADIPVIDASGVFTGMVTENNNTLGCRSSVDRNDVIYKIVLSEDSYLSVKEANSDFDAVLALREECANGDTELVCGDFMYSDDFSGYFSAGTYYLLLEAYSSSETDPYMLDVVISSSPCKDVACNGANESGECTPSDDGTSYTCGCNESYYRDNNGNCVSPCDTVACPDAAANGTGCVATSLTEYSCGCADNYFEVITGDVRTCESGCDVANLDCSAEGEHVECRSTSATEAECGCASGYYDADSEATFNCVEATNGGDTCADAVSIGEGTYFGSTAGMNNSYGEATCLTEDENGADVVYSIDLPAGYTMNLAFNNDVSWSIVYLMDGCDTETCVASSGIDTGSGEQTLEYTNSGDDVVTLFIVLDSWSSGNAGQDMNYQLDVILTPPPLCGNGVVDSAENEECDNSATDPLNGQACSIDGTLKCNDDCTFDRTECWECDTDDGSQCSGTTPVCYLDTHTCGAAVADCGNNTIESPEECDGTAVFDSSCPAGMSGLKTCIAPGEVNECMINDTACELCEDDLTLNADPKNSSRDDALDITFSGSQHSWNDLSTSMVESNSCNKVEDWYKVTVPANMKISVDIFFIDDDGDLDLNLYAGTDNTPVGGSYGSGHSGSTTDDEHVSNIDEIKDVETVYYVQVKYRQNTYNMTINIDETCTTDADCSGNGWSCINEVCYNSNPCSGVDCSTDKPDSTCVPTNGTEYECVCDDTFTELDGQCVQEQAVSGADTCGDTAVEITSTGIYTGSVTSDDTTLGCTSGSNEVFYKIVLANNSYLSVSETSSNFNASLALRTTCDDDTSDVYCSYADNFDGYYDAGTYYLVVEAYSSSSIDYSLDVIIKDSPCNGVVCDGANESGVCTPSDDTTSYKCECADGMYDDGDSCIDACAGNDCDVATEVCISTAADAYVCQCADNYSELDGNCVQEQDVVGANTCDPDADIPIIDTSGVFTGSVTTNNNDFKCSSNSGNNVVYKVELSENSYLSVKETNSAFDAVLSLRPDCADKTTDMECTDSPEFFDGYYDAGIYYLVVGGYYASDVDYSLSVVIKDSPCKGIACDGANESGVCTPSDDGTSYKCECADGMYDDGDSCIDACAGNDCDVTTEKCVAATADTYNCECADGYSPDVNGVCVADLGVDTCTEDPYLIDASGTFIGTTDGNSDDYGTISCGKSWDGSGNDVVYQIDLNSGDELNLLLHRTAGSASDISLMLLSACDENGYTCEVGVDGVSGDEEISFTVTTTSTYFIVVDAYSSGGYDYELTVDLTTSTPASTIGWCNTQWPKTIDANDTDVYGQVYVDGVTNITTDTGDASISAQLCYYADGQTTDDSVCVDATFNKSVSNSDNDEYKATLTGLSDGTYNYYFQFKTSDDADYLLCDLNDTRNGTAYNSNETYDGETGVATINTSTTTGNLIITEVVDYDGNANIRYVEVYADGGSVNLDGWKLRKYANANTTSTKFDYPNITLNAGETFIIAKNPTEFNTVFGFMPDNTSTTSVVDVNGDDNFELVNPADEVVDVYGVVGIDGTGEAWEYEDAVAVRNIGVTEGNTTWTASEWTITAGSADVTPSVR